MKITEARLRQIIREELAERRKHEDGRNEAMKGTPAVDARAKMPYDEETEEADLFMQGFEQGEYDFGYRMEGEEGDDALNEFGTRQSSGTYRSYSSRGGDRSRGGRGARGSGYAQGYQAQVREKIENVIGREELQKLVRTVPAVVSIIQNSMHAHANGQRPGFNMLDDLGKRLAAAKRNTSNKDFSYVHANVFINKVYPSPGAADPKQIVRQRLSRR